MLLLLHMYAQVPEVGRRRHAWARQEAFGSPTVSVRLPTLQVGARVSYALSSWNDYSSTGRASRFYSEKQLIQHQEEARRVPSRV